MVNCSFKWLPVMALLAGFFVGCGGEAGAGGEGASSSSTSSSSSSSSSTSSSSGDMSGGQAYENADGIRGGQLYDTFWASETGFSVANSKLSNQAQIDTMAEHQSFFRCVDCHGWDRLGREGGYSNQAPSATRPRVADINLAKVSDISSPQALFNHIKAGANRRTLEADLSAYHPQNNAQTGDSMPDYGQILTDAQIWDIVKFLKESALDTTALYDLVLLSGDYPRQRGFLNMGVDGSAIAGDALYQTYCMACHGEDGTTLLVNSGAYTLGKFMRDKPFEAQHKIKFGTLGTIMGPILQNATLADVQDLYAALTDKTRYLDVKPQPEPQPDPDPQPDPQPDPAPAIDGEFAFLKHCSSCHSGAGEGTPRYGDVTGASASLINTKIQTIPIMAHLKPDDPAQAASLEEVEAIAQFLNR